ncbi:CHAT domain-containing protein [Nonomuraea sp. NPDC050310]|uniref:CHAT domain-containing protein n=1 Tax=Nonomuraea sp. NPDC050310 TaxID=3154935 RepID=UPI0033F587D5
MVADPLLSEPGPGAAAPGPRDELLARAEGAVIRSVVDPAAALATGRGLLALAERLGAGQPRSSFASHWPAPEPAAHEDPPDDPELRAAAPEMAAVSLRAMALAARELGDLRMAEHCLRRAIALPGVPAHRVAQARLSLVTVRTERGHPLQALRIAALAYAHLPRLDRAKLETQRAVALAHLGRCQEAVAACDRAVAELSRADDSLDNQRFLAGGLLNRGLVHAYRAEWPEAVRDITACRELSTRHRLDHLARLATANLPFVAVRQGDIAAAFAHYRASEDTLFGFTERLATMRTDFAGALLAAHLPGEARVMLSLALPELEAAGAGAALAEARLKLAQVELLTGDARRAAELAGRARDELSGQDRHVWAPVATDTLLRARLALEPPTPELVDELLACADELDRGPASATCGAGTRLLAAETALKLGATETAAAQLTRLTAAPGRSVPPVIHQHALALEAALDGDPATAFGAVLDGLAGIGHQVRRLDDPAIRAHTARAGERLAAFGLRLALGDGRPEQVFAWAERWRAVTATGRPQTVRLAAVRTALGGRALVEFLIDDGELVALLAGPGRPVLRRLGPVQQIGEAVVRVRYALRRVHLADGGLGVEAAQDLDALAAAAGELEELLFAPLAAGIGESPLVIVPAGPLHTVPWAALPYLRGRPVSVASSARAWYAARVGPRRAGKGEVAVCAGPGLRHAEREAETVARHHAGATRVPATVAEVLAALDRAEVVHLAAHGTFHARSPLLSSLTLEDRPLMAYDLLRVAGPPRLVVLSACDSGMAHVPAEGAALGLAGAFLAQGTSCVVAGMVPVPDEETAALMDAFHRRLAGRETPERALAAAAAETGARGFVCFGAGDRPLGRQITG